MHNDPHESSNPSGPTPGPEAGGQGEAGLAHLERWSPVAEAMRHPQNPLVTRAGNTIDPPDPGTPLSRLAALVVACVVVLLVVLWQNTPDPTKEMLFFGHTTPPTPISPHEPAPGNFGQVDLVGRLFLRGYGLFKTQPIMKQFQSPADRYIDADRVRLVMLAGEFEGDDAALTRINAMRFDLHDRERPGESRDLIVAELDALETLYTMGPEALEPEQQIQIGDRYGYIGDVALTHGLPDTDPRREPLISGFLPIAIFLALAAMVAVLGPLMGLIALIMGSVYLSSGRLKLRGHVPTPGGSVFLETYALFVGAFIVMAVGTFLVSHSSMPELAGFSLVVQWLLLLTVMWGLVRGMPARRWRHAIGWHAGEGVFKEIGCGIVGYLACLPLYIVGVIITVILLLTKELLASRSSGGLAPAPEPMTNPIFEMIAHGDLFLILLLFVLATTWAPIVEEAIFRGALFRHFRGRVHWSLAALGTAVLFAFMHDYGPLMVAPLIALGFMFAFMREWRGSLIAPMTAHFLHNFTLMAFMITFVQLIKDPV